MVKTISVFFGCFFHSLLHIIPSIKFINYYLIYQDSIYIVRCHDESIPADKPKILVLNRFIKYQKERNSDSIHIVAIPAR